MAVTMKGTIFWDVMPCSLVENYQRFGGMYSLHLQGQGVRLRGLTSQKIELLIAPLLFTLYITNNQLQLQLLLAYLNTCIYNIILINTFM
jgi:hypothetical protein